MLKKKRKRKKKDFYVDEKLLKKELIAWKKCGTMSDALGRMLMAIVNGLGHKRNFSGYTYIEDMKGLATEFLIKYARNYNPTKSNANAFSYCTQISYCAFIQFIQKEQKQTKIRKHIYEEQVNRGGMLKIKKNICPFEIYIEKSGESNRINDDEISDLITDYNRLVRILKGNVAEKIQAKIEREKEK